MLRPWEADLPEEAVRRRDADAEFRRVYAEVGGERRRLYEVTPRDVDRAAAERRWERAKERAREDPGW